MGSSVCPSVRTRSADDDMAGSLPPTSPGSAGDRPPDTPRDTAPGTVHLERFDPAAGPVTPGLPISHVANPGAPYPVAVPDPEIVLSVVVPMYDEEAVLPLFATRLRPVLDSLETTYEVLAVDDGSRDGTAVALQRMRRTWPQLRVLRLRANAGHQAALSAGLSRARGNFVVTIDADLQDPPEVIPDMLEQAQAGDLDVVYGVRTDRSTDSVFKRVSAGVFYRVLRRLSGVEAPVDAGDFRLMSRAMVDAVGALPERDRVLRLVVPALQFPSGSVGYRREARAAGQSKYPLSKMIRLSLDAVTGFSLAPLRIATWTGLLGGLVALTVLGYAVIAQLLGRTLPGWTSLVVIVSTVGALQLLALGILGEYVGRIYFRLQARPAYFVAHDSLLDTGGAGPGARGASPAGLDIGGAGPATSGGQLRI